MRCRLSAPTVWWAPFMMCHPWSTQACRTQELDQNSCSVISLRMNMQRSGNVDVDIKGTSGLANILREIGRSERKTQQLLDSGNDHKLNLQQFNDLVSPSPPPGSGCLHSGSGVVQQWSSCVCWPSPFLTATTSPSLVRAFSCPLCEGHAVGVSTMDAATLTCSSVNKLSTIIGVMLGICNLRNSCA